MASLVEMFHMPMREIEKKFTLSEITLIAWRSHENSMQMRKRINKGRKTPPVKTIQHERAREFDAQIPEGLPEEFFNDDQEVDLSGVDSQHAVKYFQSFGIYFPTIVPGSPPKPPNEVK